MSGVVRYHLIINGKTEEEKDECTTLSMGSINISHDQSATGSTLFIEPMAVVKLNNDIRELELKEQKEIEVILASLSQQVAAELEAIHADLSIMVQLDFIFARAALAMDMNCLLYTSCGCITL